jgi:7-cyano-7-deazaguanine reductase|tara:strand:+ start:1017 stop:1736 length:720 start_codon:yes stop_codon:yes gene_type:complete
MAGPLGKKVNIPTSFSPDILFPIEREQQRHRFGLDVMSGEDIWNLHEIHWLDHENKAHKNETALIINAESKFTVESKSMKLFINSFIHERFQDFDEVRQTIIQHIEPITLNGFLGFTDICECPPCSGSTNIRVESDYNLKPEENLYDGLVTYRFLGFRSLCPVTGQPDLADIVLTADIDQDQKSNIAAYLGSFFNKECFHESCIELIHKELNSSGIKVKQTEGFFERRGGIAIVPVRNS